MPAKTLVIALAGLDDRILQLAREARAAPCLGDLSQRLRVRSIEHEPGSTDDSRWATFQYGVGPGRHGRYFKKRPDRTAEDGYRYFDSGEEQVVPFWLEEAFRDQNIAVFDLPKMRVVKPPRGLHLAHWLVREPYSRKGAVSQPPEVALHVRNRFGESPPTLGEVLDSEGTEAKTEMFLNDLLLSVDMKVSAATHYLLQDSWDCFLTSFGELDCALLNLWHTLPKDPEDFRVSPFFRLFRAIDTSVEKLIRTAGPECALCLFSPTGTRATSSVSHLAKDLLTLISEDVTPSWERLLRGVPFQLLPYESDSLAIRVSPRWRGKRAALLRSLSKSLESVFSQDSEKPIFRAPILPQEMWPGKAEAVLPHLIAPLRPALGQPASLRVGTLGEIRGDARPLASGGHFGDGICLLSEALGAVTAQSKIPLEALGRGLLSSGSRRT